MPKNIEKGWNKRKIKTIRASSDGASGGPVTWVGTLGRGGPPAEAALWIPSLSGSCKAKTVRITWRKAT